MMRLDSMQSEIGSSGTIPGNRMRMYRSIKVTLKASPRYTNEHGYQERIIANFECTPHEARLLARALVAEAKVVEAAKR